LPAVSRIHHARPCHRGNDDGEYRGTAANSNKKALAREGFFQTPTAYGRVA